MNRLRTLWLNVNTSLWFAHTLMVAGAIGLAFALVFLDAGMSHDWVPDYPLLFAGVILASLPVVVAYVFLQRYFVAGITAGASKG